MGLNQVINQAITIIWDSVLKMDPDYGTSFAFALFYTAETEERE